MWEEGGIDVVYYMSDIDTGWGLTVVGRRPGLRHSDW